MLIIIFAILLLYFLYDYRKGSILILLLTPFLSMVLIGGNSLSLFLGLIVFLKWMIASQRKWKVFSTSVFLFPVLSNFCPWFFLWILMEKSPGPSLKIHNNAVIFSRKFFCRPKERKLQRNLQFSSYFPALARIFPFVYNVLKKKNTFVLA